MVVTIFGAQDVEVEEGHGASSEDDENPLPNKKKIDSNQVDGCGKDNDDFQKPLPKNKKYNSKHRYTKLKEYNVNMKSSKPKRTSIAERISIAKTTRPTTFRFTKKPKITRNK